MSLAAPLLCAVGCASAQPGNEASASSPSTTVAMVDRPVDVTFADVARAGAIPRLRAWIAGDTTVQNAYGAIGATDELPGVVNDPGRDWIGCSEDGGAGPEGPVCTWTGEFSKGRIDPEVRLTGNPSDG